MSQNSLVSQEIQALKAIYESDFSCRQEKVSAWKVEPKTIYTLALKPFQLSFPLVYLDFEYPIKYPDAIPILQIRSQDISPSLSRDLLKRLKSLAETLQGQEMMYELASYVQEFLTDSSQLQFSQENPKKSQEFPSFYDEMKSRLQKEEQEAQLLTQLEFEKTKALEHLHHHKVQSQLASEIQKEIELKKAIIEKEKERKRLEENQAAAVSEATSFLALDQSLFEKKSRYEADFEELEFLGKGSYGSVVKARNRIDGRLYAIKKIKLDPRDQEYSKIILREVQALSRLSSQYVVRYYQSWFEKVDGSIWVEEENASDMSSFDGSFDDLHSSDWLQSPMNELSFRLSTTNDSHAAPLDLQLLLYIQMEYCEKKTLKDVIETGLDDTQIWKLFRQILEGLYHIHHSHMIHRDIKPCNIFLDQEGNIKIGDFGLVTLHEEWDQMKRNESQVSNDSSLTSDIGTPVYTAPEILSGNKKSYNYKVDLYSLGICFFEMCYPMNTGMQRALVLRDLRSIHCTLPKDFNFEKFEKQAQIIQLLLQHDPDKRPSAEDILKSPLLPVMLEEQYLSEAIKSLTTRANYPRFVASLFETPVDPHKDYSFDFNAYPSLDVFLSLVQTKLSMHAEKVFSRHGALNIPVPLFMIKNDSLYPKSSNKNPVCFMDVTGNVLQIPWDFTVPWARYISRTFQNHHKLKTLKRYTIGPVYRNNMVGGQPKSVLECDFDIVSRSVAVDMVMEAEGTCFFFDLKGILNVLVIKTVFELLDSDVKPLDTSRLQVRISHSNILSFVLSHCKLENESLIPRVLEQLHKPLSWSELKQQLLTKSSQISKESMDKLESFDFEDLGSFEMCLHRFKSLVLPSKEILSTLQDLETLVRFLVSFGIKRIVFIPLLSYNFGYYQNGTMFQIAYTSTKKLDVIAAGGRYDSLLEQFQYPFGSKVAIQGVGVNIAFSKLVSKKTSERVKQVHSKTEDSRLESSYRRADILISSYGKSREIMDEKLSLLHSLWNLNFSADVSLESEDSITNELLEAMQQGYLFLIIVKSRMDQKVYFKVKNLVTKSEVELSKLEMIPFLSSEYADLIRVDKHKKLDTMGMDLSTIKSPAKESYLKEMIHLELNSNRKTTKSRSNKSQIIERAQSCIEKTMHSVQKSPVLLIDLARSDLKKLCLLDFNHDSDYEKMVLNYFAPQQLEYLKSIKRQVKRMNLSLGESVWFHSSVDSSTVLCSL